MATQAEIARRAGVSQMTVSRALRGHPHVDAATRARVLEMAREIGYGAALNGDARRLASRRRGGVVRTHIVCILRYAPGRARVWRDPWAGLLSEAMQAPLFDAEMQVLLADIRESRVPANLRAGVVDGILAICPRSDVVEALTKLDVPVVGVANTLLPSYACQDDYAVGRIATEHLLSLGHTRIALFHPLASPNARLRQQGFVDALESAGRSPDPDLIVTAEGERAEEAVPLFQELWRRRQDFTALVAYNDEVAAWLLRAAEGQGIEVPRDLSIIGVDDLPWVTLLKPSLTTVRLPLMEIGEAAARILLQRLTAWWRGEPDLPAGETACRLPVELVVRGTTAPPPR